MNHLLRKGSGYLLAMSMACCWMGREFPDYWLTGLCAGDCFRHVHLGSSKQQHVVIIGHVVIRRGGMNWCRNMGWCLWESSDRPGGRRRVS